MISLIADTRAKRYVLHIVLHAACDSVTHLFINGKKKPIKKCFGFFMNLEIIIEGVDLASPRQAMPLIRVIETKTHRNLLKGLYNSN